MMGDQQRALGQGDPAASMSLLTQLLMNPLDAGYYEYSSRGGHRSVWQKAGVLVLSVLLGVAAVTAVSSLRSPSRLDVADSLGEQVQRRSQAVEDLTAQVDGLRESIDARSAVDLATPEALRTGTAVATSAVAVSGPGLRITVKELSSVGIDSPAGRQGMGKIRDHDLRMIVNALWGGGAEAISINGVRIGPGSFIRTAGKSILVNITPVQAPYVIDAVGDGPSLSVAIVQGETGDYLSSVESAHGITITSQAMPELSLPQVKPRALRYTQVMED